MIKTIGIHRLNRLRLSAMAGFVSVIFAATAPAAPAAVFTVTNIDDSGAGSLRQAIVDANAGPGADEIVFQPGLTGVIILATELTTVTEALTITGPGPRLISITGSNTRRILSADASLSIFGLRLANGFTDTGAGIKFNAAGGLLNVSDCHFDQHLATGNGGAIAILAGSAIIERTTFTTDQSATQGGCIWYGQGGGTPTMTITNCTFVNNFASNSGGAIRQSDTTAYATSITNCTFVVNNAGQFGGAIAVSAGTMTLLNSLFTANGAGGNPGGHVGGAAPGLISSLGHNLFGHLDGSNLAPDPTDRFGTIPAQLNTGILIAFPFNNGGLTDTLPPANGASILIDGGAAVGAPTTDQRGFPRVGCAPDVGAFEVQNPDRDNDGLFDCLDNCPDNANLNQADNDGDAQGDVCDPDDDNDGIADAGDNCPFLASPNLTNSDADAEGDVCDADDDNDGALDAVDGCPLDAAKIAPGACGCGVADTNTDGDGLPDCVDACPTIASVGPNGCPGGGCLDSDFDGACDDADNCLIVANGNQEDGDDDGVGDACDNCPDDVNDDQTDADDDGVGDACAPIPPAEEVDSDGDSVTDNLDECADTPADDNVNELGCAPSQLDSDADGVTDDLDECSDTPAESEVDEDGCPLAIVEDRDGDGVADEEDNCSDDANADQADGDDDGLGDACDDVDDNEVGQEIPDDGQGQGFSLCGALGLITLWPMLLGLMMMRRRRF